MPPLPQTFYAQNTLVVAPALLGQRLVHIVNGQRLSGLICEVEAYRGPHDQASHAYHRTPRSAIMYGPPGHAYVYFIYGRNYCMNVVTEPDGEAGAVLLRALVPEEGVAEMRRRRGPVPERQLTDGPGKLCQALGIDRSLNGTDLTTSSELFLEPGPGAPAGAVRVTPRIGVRGDEETRARLWRYLWRWKGSVG